MTNEELENQQPQEEVVEETTEVTTTEEPREEEEEKQDENLVTIPKTEYTKLRRQATAYKSQKDTQPSKKNDDISRDELVLIAKGYEEEDLSELNAIARGKGISLKEALDTPLFKAYENKRNEEKKKAKAKLAASNGSGYQAPETITKPGMTRAEHEAVFQKMINKQ